MPVRRKYESMRQLEPVAHRLPDSLIERFCLLAKNNPDLRCFDFFEASLKDDISPSVKERFKNQVSLLRAMRIFGIYNFAWIRKTYPTWNFVFRKKQIKILISIERKRNGAEVSFKEAVREAIELYLNRE